MSASVQESETSIQAVKDLHEGNTEVAERVFREVAPQKVTDLTTWLARHSSGEFRFRPVVATSLPGPDQLHALRRARDDVPSSESDSEESSGEDERPSKPKRKRGQPKQGADKQPNKKRKVESKAGVVAEGKRSHNGSQHVTIPPHKGVAELAKFLKGEVYEMVRMFDALKVWIQLNIPRIEDGNNFGVSVQEEVVSELGRAEEHGYSILESITKYHITRARLMTKVIKYPEVLDFQQSVHDLDEKEWNGVHHCVVDIRNSYALVLDLVAKNYDKLKTPRSSEAMRGMF